MVAEFRQAKPQLVYVNLNDTISSEGQANAREPQESSSGPYRRVIKENIIRRGDTFLSKLMNVDPEVRPLIMGSSSPSELEISSYSQMDHFPNDQSYVADPSNVDENFGAESSFAAGRSSTNSTQVGGGSHTSAHNDYFGAGFGSQVSNPFSSHNNVPQIRLADFSNVASFGLNESRSSENSLLRSYTLDNPSSMSNSAFNSNYDGAQVPNVTIIRSTSTYAIRTGPGSSPFNLDNGTYFNNTNGSGGHINDAQSIGAQCSHVAVAGPNVDAHSVLNGASTSGACGAYGHGDSSRHCGRRAGGSIGPVRPRHSSTEVLCGDPQCKATKYLLNQESILRENEALKRKLQLLAGTISDREKLAKVLRCLADRKNAAAARR